jgi:DNA polymerase-3 subunit epsilon
MRPSWWPGSHRSADQARRWLVLDVETTGLDVRRDTLLAIAAVALHNDGARLQIRPGDSFEALLRAASAPAADARSGGAPDKTNILLHGIGVQAQRTGADPAQVLRTFGNWAAGAPLLGFHVGFDRQMICRAERRHLRWPERAASRARWIDIEPLAAVAGPPSRQPLSLDDWLQRFDVPCGRRHQAAADALATAELLLRLWPALHRQGARTAGDLHRLASDRRWVAAPEGRG